MIFKSFLYPISSRVYTCWIRTTTNHVHKLSNQLKETKRNSFSRWMQLPGTSGANWQKSFMHWCRHSVLGFPHCFRSQRITWLSVMFFNVPNPLQQKISVWHNLKHFTTANKKQLQSQVETLKLCWNVGQGVSHSQKEKTTISQLNSFRRHTYLGIRLRLFSLFSIFACALMILSKWEITWLHCSWVPSTQNLSDKRKIS